MLGEKPFASLDSVRRIVAACRENDVAFMDGTHFPHHPRTHEIRARGEELVGRVGSLASAFQFTLSNRSNIRYDPGLEPMGAIGFAGWYTMRAAVEYLPPDVELEEAAAFLRRDEETGAVFAGSGVLRFTGGVHAPPCGVASAVGQLYSHAVTKTEEAPVAAPSLGDFELLVMLAAFRLGPDEAYTVSIVEDIARRTGRSVRRANVYTTLRRLEAKGLVATRLGDPRPERGGRPRRLVTLEPEGLSALRATTMAIESMVDGLMKDLREEAS